MKIKSLIILSLLLCGAMPARADKTAAESTGGTQVEAGKTAVGKTTTEQIVDEQSGEDAAVDEEVADEDEEVVEATPCQLISDALEVAIPFAEAGILNDRSWFAPPLDKVDFHALDAGINAIAPLMPYSDKISTHVDNMFRFMEISRLFNDCTDFDMQPYDKTRVDDVQSLLISIYDMGEGMLNSSQQEQIDALYEYAGEYLAAVESFDELMKSIDAEVTLFRNNERGAGVCAGEIERVMGESTEALKQIANYRYLAQLLSRYRQELKANPQSDTPEIKEELAMMLSSGETTDTVTATVEEDDTTVESNNDTADSSVNSSETNPDNNSQNDENQLTEDDRQENETIKK